MSWKFTFLRVCNPGSVGSGALGRCKRSTCASPSSVLSSIHIMNHLLASAARGALIKELSCPINGRSNSLHLFRCKRKQIRRNSTSTSSKSDDHYNKTESCKQILFIRPTLYKINVANALPTACTFLSRSVQRKSDMSCCCVYVTVKSSQKTILGFKTSERWNCCDPFMIQLLHRFSTRTLFHASLIESPGSSLNRKIK